LVEQSPCKRQAVGSSPTSGSVNGRSSAPDSGSPRAPRAGSARRLRRAAALLVLPLVWPGAGCGGRSASSPPTGGAAAKREALGGQRNPIGAPGRTLGLARVVIPPSATLPLHRHEGSQVAYVERGTLTYTVVRGAVEVMRGSPDARPARVRRIGPGTTGTITAGQWIIEDPGDVHRAANRGRVAVVVLLSSLLRSGAAPATPVAGPAGR
jgi:quercetin dioxygenase-like cupin family protein